MDGAMLPWVLFLAFVIGMLVLDLGVFHRHAHTVSRREAAVWSLVWVALALAFNAGVYAVRGPQVGFEWTTGYLIEKSLSVDNIFVFLLIFSAFQVPSQYQHRVLFWGILGALVMRAAMILAGTALLEQFHPVIYLFGAFLIYTGLKFFRGRKAEPALEENRVLRLTRRLFPTTATYEGARFFVRRQGVLHATPLFLVLVLVESTDVVFAVDSIPAIFAVTRDPFIVFTSNIFAILGLRALYFFLAGYLAELKYLKPALAVVLIFVGAKMLLTDVYKVPAPAGLAFIAHVLGVAVVASVRAQRRTARVPVATGERYPPTR
jgi:tellurite resistance protein TerC